MTMMTKKIIFLSAQPDDPYFHWQVEVLIHNFMAVGINPNWIELVFGHWNEPSQEYWNLANRYPYVRFFNYKRTISSSYVSIVRPDVLEQHFEHYPELRGEVIFYHDSDIVFRELPDFDKFFNDHYWYLSDTVSYIGAEYIQSKSPTMLSNLSAIVGIDPKVLINNQRNSGGAQTLAKGMTTEFWRKTKEDAISLYDYMVHCEEEERSLLTTDQLLSYNPIQKWCADMWALLWNAWLSGAETRVVSELNFSWATSSIQEYNNCSIMHNAGATTSADGLFYKGEYINKSPFDADLSWVKPNCASHEYVKWVQYAKERRA